MNDNGQTALRNILFAYGKTGEQIPRLDGHRTMLAQMVHRNTDKEATMTNEQAIKELKKLKCLTNAIVGEALRMAIEALSNQQKWIDEELQNYLIENADLVTCKDCKHRSDGGWCDVYIQPRMDTDFCNYGERKGGDTE